MSSVAAENARPADTKSTVDKLDAERIRLADVNAELRACSDATRDSITAAQKADKACLSTCRMNRL